MKMNYGTIFTKVKYYTYFAVSYVFGKLAKTFLSVHKWAENKKITKANLLW
jgi:hypothetical protein